MVELDNKITAQELSKIKELITDTMCELVHSYKLFNLAYNSQANKNIEQMTTTHRKMAYQMLANSVIKADAVIYFLSQLLQLDDADSDTVDKIIKHHFKQYDIEIGGEKESASKEFTSKKSKPA